MDSPSSPNVYVRSPEGELSVNNCSLPESDRQLLEKQAGELITLRHKLKYMESYQNDLLDEIQSLQEELDSMKNRNFEGNNRVKTTRLSFSFRDRSLSESDSCRSPEENLKMKAELKETKNTVMSLEDKVQEVVLERNEVVEDNKLLCESLQEQRETVKLLKQELCQNLDERDNLLGVVAEKDEIIASFRIHCRQLQEMISEFKSSTNVSLIAEEPLDLGKEMMDVQLQEYKLALQKSEETLESTITKMNSQIDELKCNENNIKAKYMERWKNYKTQVEEILKKEMVKFENLKKEYHEVCSSKEKLEEENEKLQRQLGQFRRDYNLSQGLIHKLQNQLQEKNLPVLKNNQHLFDLYDDPNRFQELHRRNALLPMHLKSCYPSELMTCGDVEVDENKLKQLPGHKNSTTTSSAFEKLKEPPKVMPQSSSRPPFCSPAPKKSTISQNVVVGRKRHQ